MIVSIRIRRISISNLFVSVLRSKIEAILISYYAEFSFNLSYENLKLYQGIKNPVIEDFRFSHHLTA